MPKEQETHTGQTDRIIHSYDPNDPVHQYYSRKNREAKWNNILGWMFAIGLMIFLVNFF